MSDIDNEIQAMGQIAGIVGALPEDQRGRVVRYIIERFNIVGISKSSINSTVEAISPEVDQSQSSADFEHLASLVDATNPSTDPMRALVAGYWLQVCKGTPSFDAQSANTELKHLGHASSNITSAFNALISQKPALVLQLRKSGNTKQARKLYMVTEAGLRRVRQMMSGAEAE